MKKRKTGNAMLLFPYNPWMWVWPTVEEEPSMRCKRNKRRASTFLRAPAVLSAMLCLCLPALGKDEVKPAPAAPVATAPASVAPAAVKPALPAAAVPVGARSAVPAGVPVAAKPAEPAVSKSGLDPRVERNLREIGYKYTVTPLGNVRFSFTLDDGRGHLVFVASKTEKFNSIETRKIWATVMKSKEPLSAELANKLLMENIPQKLGSYELTKVDEGGYKVQFAVRLDADAKASKMKDALRLVLVTADAKEKELTNADEF